MSTGWTVSSFEDGELLGYPDRNVLVLVSGSEREGVQSRRGNSNKRLRYLPVGQQASWAS
jgi:hypothetical protein